MVANKQRRNDLKSPDSDALKALIPDVKINYLTRDIEILIIEQAKDKIVDDIPKNSNDKFKACIEMHDMLYVVEECIPVDNKSEIQNIKVFAIMISSK